MDDSCFSLAHLFSYKPLVQLPSSEVELIQGRGERSAHDSSRRQVPGGSKLLWKLKGEYLLVLSAHLRDLILYGADQRGAFALKKMLLSDSNMTVELT